MARGGKAGYKKGMNAKRAAAINRNRAKAKARKAAAAKVI